MNGHSNTQHSAYIRFILMEPAFSLLFFFSSVHERNVVHIFSTKIPNTKKHSKTTKTKKKKKKSYSSCMQACKTRFAVHFYILRQTDGWIGYSSTQRSACIPLSPHALEEFPSFFEHGTSCKGACTRSSSPKTWMDGWMDGKFST